MFDTLGRGLADTVTPATPATLPIYVVPTSGVSLAEHDVIATCDDLAYFACRTGYYSNTACELEKVDIRVTTFIAQQHNDVARCMRRIDYVLAVLGDISDGPSVDDMSRATIDRMTIEFVSILNALARVL